VGEEAPPVVVENEEEDGEKEEGEGPEEGRHQGIRRQPSNSNINDRRLQQLRRAPAAMVLMLMTLLKLE
jgi:hypothetical protein